jgi:hypothetical protein
MTSLLSFMSILRKPVSVRVGEPTVIYVPARDAKTFRRYEKAKAKTTAKLKAELGRG